MSHSSAQCSTKSVMSSKCWKWSMKTAVGFVAELLGDLVDEVQRQRGVFPARPHHGRVVVLL